ncbi:hypothetical protein [Porphyromonas sp.]
MKSMKRVQLVFLRDRSALDARSKAPTDVEKILATCGYESCYLNLRLDQPGYLRAPLVFWDLFRAILSIPKGGELCVQYPVTSLFFHWYWLLQRRSVRLIAVIHDLESFRYTGALSVEEQIQLSRFDSIIAHTPAMKELLVANGISSKHIQVLDLFDYLAPEPPVYTLGYQQHMPRVVCFAGNLEKSLFLPDLKQIVSPSLHISLYGVGLSEEVKLSDELRFEGKFSPDDLSLLRGHYGLVWDGDSIETCAGRIGEYLQINAPHKASLYIAAGLPLIVWSHSAIAPYVLEHQLGIAIDSLMELPERLASIDWDQYTCFCKAVREKQSKINQGQHLRDIISALSRV